MTITLPDEMRAMLQQKAEAGGFASVDDYVIDALTENDEVVSTSQPHFRTREELEKLIDKGMASGVAGVVDHAFWARLDHRILERAAANSVRS